jgi:hypothetical protein
MHLWLASYPRSGNTFLRILLRQRYAVRSVCTEFERDTPPPRTIRRSAILTPDYASAEDPVVPDVIGLKTHALPANTTDPAFYVVRDGRDSLVSYAHFALTHVKGVAIEEITPGQVTNMIRELILYPRLNYGTWSQNVEVWTRRPNTIVIRFEELVSRPAETIDRAMAELGIGLGIHSETIPTFEELHQASGRFFRRGAIGAWSEVFSQDLHALFWKHNGAVMKQLGYPYGPPQRASA